MLGRFPLLAGLALLGILPLPVWGQEEINRFNERHVEKKTTPQDRDGIYMLDFHFKDPRVITVDIPGRGRRLVWYLWYQVSNNTGQPRDFHPQFAWVCHDEDTAHMDQVLPKAQAAIQRLEDPTNLLECKNSVTISAEKVPISKEFDEKGNRVAFPKTLTGVAMWDDINPRSHQFSIYVYGLSDGYTVVDGPDGKPIVRVKTLQLRFKRLGDEFNQNSGQIRYLGSDWIYAPRDLPAKIPEGSKKAPPAEVKPDAPAPGQGTVSK